MIDSGLVNYLRTLQRLANLVYVAMMWNLRYCIHVMLHIDDSYR